MITALLISLVSLKPFIITFLTHEDRIILLKLLASLRSSLRDGPSLRYGALHSSLSLLAILAWGIKLILISIANKATETCPEANISV